MTDPDTDWCNWVLETSGGATATGTKAKHPVKEGGSVTLTLTLVGPVFGPDAHTYEFGARSET